MVRRVQNQSFLLIIAASTKLRIFFNPLASLYDGLRIEVPPIQTWKLHPMNVSAIHVAELCRIIHPRCIRNRYSPPLRSFDPAHPTTRAQSARYSNSEMIRSRPVLCRTDSHIHLFHWDFPVEPYGQPVPYHAKSAPIPRPFVFFQPLCCFIFCTLWENKLLVLTQTSWQVIFPLI